ncbi:MAG: hypothetical protein K0R84_2774 [Clostridia bacterium]|nr:hypothetical protein [Clostridia bacterium]
MGLVFILLFLILSIIFYCLIRAYLNKNHGLNLPLVPDRYYDDPELTLTVALITVGSLVLGIFFAKLLLGLL